jgi:hypothetical protein
MLPATHPDKYSIFNISWGKVCRYKLNRDNGLAYKK